MEETIVLSADVFADGHDEIRAAVLVKQKTERRWKEFPMSFAGNDRWEYHLEPETTGIYQFQVLGWVDHYATWKKGLLKKYEAGQDIVVEQQIGAELIEQAARTAFAKNRPKLLQWSESLRNAKTADISSLFDPEVEDLMSRHRETASVTMFPEVFCIEIERRKAAFSTWYEIFPRSTAAEPGQHGTFNDVKRLLPRIAEMGFDTLYLPPIHPIGKQHRKGKNNSLTATPDDPGSPWAIGGEEGGHTAIHPRLGTLKDFRSLVSAAKKYNIEIALDIAFQCSPDHPYVKEHPQWFKWRPDGKVQYAENPPKKYEDILPFYFENDDWVNLWKELKNVVEYWIGNGINVFRVDNPHTKPIAFWKWLIGEVRKKNPQVIFLAEAFTRPRIMEELAKIGFNQSYTYFSWRNTKAELEAYMKELTKTSVRHYFRPNFWPNTPDILPPVLTYGGENAHIIRLVLAATLSSNYGLYGPVYEFCINTPMPGKEEYIDNEKYEIRHWNWEQETRLREIITCVNRIRRDNPAFHCTWNIEFAETTNEQIICYAKADPKTKNIFIVAVNLDPFNTQGGHVKIPLEKLGLSAPQQYTVRDLLGGDRYRWGEWNYVQLNPHEMPAHILKVDQL